MMMEDWADKGGAVLATRPDGAIVVQRAEMEIIVRSYAFFKEGARFAFLGRWIWRGRRRAMERERRRRR